MNVSQFTRTVREMRQVQKSYFKNRLRADLEAMVDKALVDGIVFDLDIVTTSTSAEEERQMRLHLEDERDAGEPEREDELE